MFKNLKIGTQIGLGFGLVLVISALIVGFAVRGLWTGSESFKAYRGLARASVLSGRVQANMLMASNAVKDFLNTRDEKRLEVFRERFQSARTFALEQQTAIEDPARRAMSRELVESLDAYRGATEEVVGLMRRRDAVLQETLNPQGTRMRQNLTEIMVSADRDEDSEAAYVAGRALERVLLGRLYLLKFLEDNKDADVERVRSELGSGFEQAFAEMERAIDNPQRKERLGEFAAARDIYLNAFEEIVTTIKSRNTLITQQMDPLERSVAGFSEQIKLSLKADQDTLGPLVQEGKEKTVRAVLIGACVGILLAVVIGLSIIRATTRPIAELVETIGSVTATGDLTQRSTIRSTDEIGTMASTLNEFLASLEIQADVAENVARGVLDTPIELRSRGDTLGSALREMLEGLADKARMVDAVARGDLDTEVTPASERDSLGRSLQIMLASLQAKARAVDAVSFGKLDAWVDPASDRDALAASINRMIETLREISRQADVISSGDYATSITPRSAEDTLGTALQRMTETLRSGAEEAALRDWTQGGQGRLHEASRGGLDEDELGARLIGALAEQLGAQRGALYVYREEPGRLQLLSGYAADNAAVEAPDFAIGEGLIGQVARDRQPLRLDDVPEGYCAIRSALGRSAPRGLLVYPLVHEERLLGVIELASVTPFDDRAVRFLSSVEENICISLRAARSRVELRELLAHTKQQAIFFRVFKDATDPIVLEDLSGKVVDLNKAAEEAYGWNKEELVGKPIKLIVPEDRRGQADELLRECLGGADVRNVEGLRVSRSGEAYDVLITLSLLKDEHDEAIAIASIAKDITSLRRAQAALETLNRDLEAKVEDRTAELAAAREAADAANRAKGDFLANMSHEIRTPMNAIIGMTDLALDTELDPEQRDYLTTVRTSAEALLSLINDILDFSKIEAGKLEIEPIDFELRDALADMLNTLATRAHGKGLELAYQVPADVPDAVIGDVYRLQQIIVNLVGNAIKFTERGEIVVSVEETERTGQDVELRFAVSDTGVGIAREKLAAIFQPFEQADVSTTRKYGGTGLGLAISVQLVELMGGRIWAQSETGRGSTFFFTVRLGVGTPRTRSTVQQEELLEGLPVLIVDDNATNRRILEEIFGNWRMTPHAVPSGAEALAALDCAANAGSAFRLVVSDVHMPEMDGFQLFDGLQARYAHVPFILMTSGTRPGDVARCREIGVAAHLIKPVKQSLLMNAIADAVAGETLATAPEAEPRPAPSEPGAPASLRVLLAEDNPVNQKFAVRALEKEGHTVLVANNGREAVDLSRDEAFDVILMDVQMPEMDGFEATARILQLERSDDGGRHTPIIAMTANAMKGDRERCLEAGMDGYVSKPVKRQTLFTEIERVLGATGQAASG